MTKPKKELFEIFINSISHYFFWLFMGNFYLVLLNFPIVFVLLTIWANGSKPIPTGFAVIVFICCLPLGPAVTALLNVMDKLIKEKDLNITKDFFKVYKCKFSQSLFFWALELFLIAVLFINLKFFKNHGYPYFITIYIYLIIVLIFILGLYIFPIVSKFSLKNKDIIKLAVYCAIKSFHITILDLICFFVVGLIFFTITNFIILFVSSLICLIIMLSNQKMLLELEIKLYCKQENSLVYLKD